ncbi:MAG TPA: nodulation protein NfeD [Xanthobacteraceae bacterium]|nr:nodulation protein NfeD [Xanthobacteraceae bacterium]
MRQSPGLLTHMRRCCAAALIAAISSLGTLSPVRAQQPPNGAVLVTTIDGVIGVSATRQITQAIQRADELHATALVLRLDTPGGLVSSTREIIKAMNGASVPVIVYVAPSGARAASAGTYITYAAHIAAMAPGTNIGAATPIEMGGGSPLPLRQNDQQKNEKPAASSPSDSAHERKVINDAVAMIRSLAQLRGRNAEWAEKAVRDAATLTADEAQKQGVVDVVAASLAELLAKIDGRKVTIGGTERVLATKDAPVTAFDPDWRTRALSVISDPNIAFILLMIGFYGLIFEFWSPGMFAPGVIGGICLLLAFIGLSTLPVHYGALALLLLGIALMVGEAFTPGTAVLGIGGLAAFVAGAVFLFEGPDADMAIAISLPLIFGAAAAMALLLFGLVAMALKARKREPAAGAEQMIGMPAEVVHWSGKSGQVRVHGEIWAAHGERPLKRGDRAVIRAREGLTLIVDPS